MNYGGGPKYEVWVNRLLFVGLALSVCLLACVVPVVIKLAIMELLGKL